jgi:hypothetical protein
VVFAEPWWRTDGDYVFDRNSGVELSADDFCLPFNAAKCRNDEQYDAIGDCSRREHSPRYGGRGNE